GSGQSADLRPVDDEFRHRRLRRACEAKGPEGNLGLGPGRRQRGQDLAGRRIDRTLQKGIPQGPRSAIVRRSVGRTTGPLATPEGTRAYSSSKAWYFPLSSIAVPQILCDAWCSARPKVKGAPRPRSRLRVFSRTSISFSVSSCGPVRFSAWIRTLAAT